MSTHYKPTADLVDDYEDTIQSTQTQFTQYGSVTHIGGTIRTIRCFEDNALVKKTLNSPGNGNILVVDGDASLRTALLGDLIAQAAVDNNWAGVIINGPVRDSKTLGTLPIHIKAIGTNPLKSGKTGTGTIDEPVSFGGVTFTPGATVVSDEDGVVILPEDHTEN